ncbi:alpha/beta hydrolase family esterase [Acidovorax sp.]|uniref:extracellular catalytic domain type 1 short-chain-length polyhydroxyalkanoate depolymerase n=1 Tax=Acidovorax sp. TaxID=1872122 RepID=UPI003918FBA4
MARRSRLFSLTALARAYQRNLKAFAKATRPPRATPAAGSLRGVSATGTATPPVARKGRAVRSAGKPTPVSGEWVAGLARGPAGARRYQLFIPPGLALQRGEKLPLLVMLHGCGQTGRELAAVSRMNRVAARQRFLVLYPEQERMANAHGCWNWFERRNGKAEAEAATLLAAVDQVARTHPVDLAQVAVAGLSAGASMAVLMAARYPARFCAVAMHSGVAPGTAESSAHAMAAMHGRRDAHLPLQAVPDEPALSSTPALTPSLPLPPLLVLHGDADGVVSVRNAAATALLWAGALGARAGALRTLQRGQRHAMRVTEFKSRGRTVVALREVVGLAHAWSGGAARRPYSDPSGPDASALIWAFVARQLGRKNMG